MEPGKHSKGHILKPNFYKVSKYTFKDLQRVKLCIKFYYNVSEFEQIFLL